MTEGMTNRSLDDPTWPSDEGTPIATQVRAGQWIGEHEILGEIACGGMGVVYRARQNRLNRLVALKLLHVEVDVGGSVQQRLETEAKAVAMLDHPGIVPVYEMGVHDGKPYFSMALVNGPSLNHLLKSNPLPPCIAAQYVEQIARAIEHAHQHGIVHYDVKPANILIDGERARLTDFGLASHGGVRVHECKGPGERQLL